MGVLREAPPAKLFVAVMHRPDYAPESILEKLADIYGAVDLRGAPFPFDHSDYYVSEMGEGLVKFLVSFGPLLGQDRLAAVKRMTNGMEDEGAGPGGKRVFNLDPGILTLSNVILATTKGHAHRIYLGEGIYEEVTLIYRRGAFEPLPWTYPDYHAPAVLDFFRGVRDILRTQTAGSHTGHT